MLSKNQLKNITALHTRKNRERENKFIVEGEKMLDELLSSEFIISEVFALKQWLDNNKLRLISRNIKFTEINGEELAKISLLSTPNMVLAIVEQLHQHTDTTVFNTGLSLYLDAIRDPGNLGTIIRLAHWFGADQVICSPDCVEIFNPKVVQSTMGSLFKVKISENTLEQLLESTSSTPFPVYGALLDGENIYTKKDFTEGILIIGNESNGIAEKNLKFISHKVKIPPASENHAESLNAAMATSVFLAEYLRRKKYF